ncbi:4,5-dihydroxyphthalate decarboxylase [Pigmentiphaga humi]|uniref:4,5-dihydroxyphthalate decarboxylase n=2 Tax=Pigmentiphaga humi TaxID=2478468 RepID=A0A3P4B3L3_9BURK|nr:4,5-dihydroxyphthalate decarboxylase [Pigmentiphaga humi]
MELVTKEIVDHDSSWLAPIRYRIFDAAEMPLTNYVIGLDEGRTDLIALPVFLSRAFRHSTLYINGRAGIRAPKDLEGKRVGIGNYFGSTTLWARGLLQDQYQVDLSAIHWVSKNKVPPDRIPASVSLQVFEGNRSMEELLDAGDIDAFISERPPQAYKRAAHVSRLFEKYKNDEIQYYRETKIFPIRHVLVVKRELYERHPWIGQSLYKLFDLAKKEADPDRMFDGHSRFMLPALQYAIAETKRIFGEDCWPYGVEKNRATLDAFTRYCHEQGYTSRRHEVEELFAPHVMSA